MATTKKVNTRVSTKPKKSSAKKAKSKNEMRSFHVAKDDVAFKTFRITRQTIYWVILVAFIIFAQLWIINLQVQVASLLDAQQAQIQQMQ